MIINPKKKFVRNVLILMRNISGPSNNKSISLTVGIYLGVFPVIGTTTIMCLLAGFLFRLNHFILQSLNILLTPFQLLLVLPFLKAGRMLLFQDKSVLPDNLFENGLLGAESLENLLYILQTLGAGVLVWLIFALLTGFFLNKLWSYILINYVPALEQK